VLFVCVLQAEQFANELTRHLGIAAPDCRIVRQVGSAEHDMRCVGSAVACQASSLVLLLYV
jgi:hypothetical protein